MKNPVGRIPMYVLSIIFMSFFISSACNLHESNVLTSNRFNWTSCINHNDYHNVCVLLSEKAGINPNIPLKTFYLPDEFYGDDYTRLFTIFKILRVRKKSFRYSKASSHFCILRLYRHTGKIVTDNFAVFKIEISKLSGTRAPPVILSYNIFNRELIYNSIRTIHSFFSYQDFSSVSISLFENHNINLRNKV